MASSPAGLPKNVVAALLDKLSSDDVFRALFEKSPAEALRAVGAPDPAGAAACMTVKKLAPKDAIKAASAQLTTQFTAALMLQPVRLDAS